MKLDEVQIAEFHRHWGECYMLYKGSPVYIQQQDGQFVSVFDCINNDKKMKVPVQDLELFNPETGYYNSTSTMGFPLAVFLTRLPRQQVSRGFSKRNSDLSVPVFKDKGNNIAFSETDISFHKEVVSLFKADYSGRAKDKIQSLIEYKRGSNNPIWKENKNYYRDEGFGSRNVAVDKICPSVALSKNIAAVRTKWGYLVLFYRKVPIGFYNEGKVYLNEAASSYKEQLEELRLGDFVWN